MLTHMLRAAAGNSGPPAPSGPIVWQTAGLYGSVRVQTFAFGTNAAAWCGAGSSATNTAALAGGAGSSYNGTVWSASTSYLVAMRSGASAGTATAGIGMGGLTAAVTSGSSYTYDGTSFTTISSATAKYDSAGAGVQNSAIIFGGNVSGTLTQLWNGSAWSTGGSLSLARQYVVGLGSSTDALAAGGLSGSLQSSTEKYNGTSWSASTAFPWTLYAAYRNGLSTTACGISLGYQQASALQNRSYTFNGSAWTLASYPPLNNIWGSGFGSNTDAMMANGQGTPSLGAYPQATLKMTYTSLLTGGVYSGAPSPTTPRRGSAGVGSPTALIFQSGANSTGTSGTYLTATEKFDGTSWSAGASMAVNTAYGAGCGTFSAGGIFGGYATAQGNTSPLMQSFNGTAFSTGGAVTTSNQYNTGWGTNTATVWAGGQTNAGVNQSAAYKYNGSTWSATGALSAVRYLLMGAGTQTDGIAGGGYDNSSIGSAVCWLFNGTTFTATGSLPQFRVGGSFFGTATTNVVCSHGLNTTITVNNSYKFTGSTWSTIGLPAVLRVRATTASTTAATSGLVTNGWDGSNYYWSSELFTG